MAVPMKPGITLKLFLAILAASVAAAAAMALATRYSFRSDFLGYLSQVEAQRPHTLPVALPDDYPRRGGGGSLPGDHPRLPQTARAGTLESTDPLRRRFMADVARELRTPLAVLSGELEALEDGVRPLSRESLASLRGEVNALSKLVNDLNQLALADVGALAYRKEKFDVAPLLEQGLESYRDRLAERGLALEASLDKGAVVFADADRLQQMFRDLLENAARSTDRARRCPVALRRAGGELAIDFEDTAPGVPSDALPHLFERFYRV